MNVYDFDGTIYQGDSSVDFYLHALWMQPELIRFLPRQIVGILGYKLGLFSKEKEKEFFFSFLSGVFNVDECVEAFWKKRMRLIAPWYKAQRQNADVIISASPEFLLAPVCRKLNVHLIASVVDSHSGHFLTLNCYGGEKLRRFEASFGKSAVVDSFYSDSYSDLPLALIARHSYIVKGNNITEWRKDAE